MTKNIFLTKEVVEDVARKLDIDSFESDLLPDRRVKLVEKTLNEKANRELIILISFDSFFKMW